MSCSRFVKSEVPRLLVGASVEAVRLAEGDQAASFDGEAVLPEGGDRVDDLAEAGRLGEKAGSAGRRHVVHQGATEGQAREHQHLHLGMPTEEAPGPRDAVGAVELDVHHGHLGLELVGQLGRLVDVERRAHAGQVLCGLDGERQRLGEDRVVVDDHHSEWPAGLHCITPPLRSAPCAVSMHDMRP